MGKGCAWRPRGPGSRGERAQLAGGSTRDSTPGVLRRASWQPQPSWFPPRLILGGVEQPKRRRRDRNGRGEKKASCQLQNPKAGEPRAAKRRGQPVGGTLAGKGKGGTDRSPVPAAAALAATSGPPAQILPASLLQAQVAAGTASLEPSLHRPSPLLFPQGLPPRTFAGSVCPAFVPSLDVLELPHPSHSLLNCPLVLTRSVSTSKSPHAGFPKRGLASSAELLPATHSF